MSKNSAISWTHHTFNTHWGCQRVSPGCEHCYAETLAKRYGYDVWGPAKTTERRTFGPKHWQEPLRWNAAAAKAGERQRVFCASMGDVFEDHPAVNDERLMLWAAIRKTPHLDWLLLTKRPENLARMLPRQSEPWPNVWLGTSVETQEYADTRIPLLLQVPAVVRFLSCEPLLGPLDLRPWLGPDEPRIHWVIVGGESGPGYRPMDLAWARALQDQCRAAGVAFFGKQRSGPRTEMPLPPDLDIREFPRVQP